MGELVHIYKMAQMFYKIPTEPGLWIEPKPKEEGAELVGAIEEVHVEVAGMLYTGRLQLKRGLFL